MDNLKAIFISRFRGFKTFTDSGEEYKREEDNYKRESSERMRSFFEVWVEHSETWMSDSEVCSAVEEVLSEKLPKTKIVPNLTNWRDNLFITKTLLAANNNREKFAHLLHKLLKAATTDANVEKELDEFIGWLNDQKVQPRYTKILPTLLLFYWNPRDHIYIKPRFFDSFLKLIGEKPLAKRLTSKEYIRALQIIDTTKNRLLEFNPRDMIDLQTFYYIVTASNDISLLLQDKSVLEDLEQEKSTYESLGRTEREAIIKSRLGQGRFRKLLLDLWGACSVTGFRNQKPLLIASHIKPWRNCSNEERLDKYNGLLLLPNMDRLFDLGWISFDDSGGINISQRLSKTDQLSLGINDKMHLLKVVNEQRKYLEYHRKNIFLD